MTLAVLAKTIRKLSDTERSRLFDQIKVSLEGYFLMKIVTKRFIKTSKKYVDWEILKAR